MSVGAPGAAGPQSMPMPGGGVQPGPMSQPGLQQPPPSPPQAPPQGTPPGGPQGAPPQGAPPNMAGGAPSTPQDPFMQQAQLIMQSLPQGPQRGLFLKNFLMPMAQQRAEAQRSAQQFEETRADRRQTAEWRHEDAATAAAAKHEDRIRDLEIKDRAERDRYEVAMQRAEDTACLLYTSPSPRD